jgi:hypothetical protein
VQGRAHRQTGRTAARSLTAVGFSAAVRALKSLQNSIMFTPSGPSAWPSAGAGLAMPAGTSRRATPFTAAIHASAAARRRGK